MAKNHDFVAVHARGELSSNYLLYIILLQRRANARETSIKVNYYFFTVLQFSIYLSFYQLYTNAAYTSLPATFHLLVIISILHRRSLY